MQVTVHSKDLLSTPTDLLVLPVGSDDGLELGAAGRAIDAALGGALRSAAKEQDFTGKPGQRLVLHTLGKLRAKRVCLLGVGPAGKRDARIVLNYAGTAARLANEVGAVGVALVPPQAPGLDAPRAATLVVRGARLGSYRYTRYRTEKERPPTFARLQLHAAVKDATAVQRAIAPAMIVADSVCLARDLANESPLQLYPETLAQRATEVARRCGLGVKVYDPRKLESMGMNLLLGVGRGSERGPRLVHLTWDPGRQANGKKAAKKAGKSARPKGRKPIVLVGKGITFDSGGLSLKQTSSMVDMKIDMHGAATVLATMQAVARLRLGVPVHGIMALAENMPSGSAIRPSDVLESAAGKTVEVTNTDAEGRLVLADALHYAVGLGPSRIIDLATLTGACMVALGPTTAGVFSNDDELSQALVASARLSGEDFWPLPLTESLKSQLKSDVADMKNSGDRYGGAIIAALFLKEFVGDVSWAHIDIAGPAQAAKDSGAVSKGGTGVGVAALVDYLAG